MSDIYDHIGKNYAALRVPDQRLYNQILDALGPAKTVLNVGAGAGSYEPKDRLVTALEPSIEMIKQRPDGAALVRQGFAEDIPFADDSFDAAMAVLTVHHWADKFKGLSEMRRVSTGCVVILTFDPDAPTFWLADYIPEIAVIDQGWALKMEAYEQALGPCNIHKIPIPRDCSDGFLCAYWQRPERYLERRVRDAISSFSKIADVTQGLAKLKTDIETGAWHEKYAYLLGLDAQDFGYRLVVSCND